AQALYKYHPTYYFLIDRDYHHDDAYIDKCWNNFPDPDTHNLLIWKYKEIENYFLEPDYLGSSEYRNVDKHVLEDKIKQCCRNRLYLDAANHVIISIREELKSTWIEKFKESDDFISSVTAIKKLKEIYEFAAFTNCVISKTDLNEMERRFNNTLQEMTGGIESLEFGVGNWLKMITGKKVLSQVINSNCFEVKDRENNLLQGKDKFDRVIKSLLKKNTDNQPDDFKELKKIIMERVLK
ncbi:MAG: hypothetical protein HQK89_07555, partial [Nitrospirae bacterium]|nr:hypothetical protein [Nitrospirota bacterium]